MNDAGTLKTVQIGDYTLRLNIPLRTVKLPPNRVERSPHGYQPADSRVRIYRSHSARKMLSI